MNLMGINEKAHKWVDGGPPLNWSMVKAWIQLLIGSFALGFYGESFLLGVSVYFVALGTAALVHININASRK